MISFPAQKKKSRQLVQEISVAKYADKKNLQLQQAMLTKRMDSLVLANADIVPLSKNSESLTTKFNKQAEIINKISTASDKVSTPGYPRTEWFKEGYYLVFDDMKIILEDILDKQSISVSVCESTTVDVCPEGKRIEFNRRLTTTSPLEISRQASKYVIRLEHIGSAGKNPFTKAA